MILLKSIKIVLNGKKYNFNKYLCVKDFLIIKNIKDIPIYNKEKDFWVNEYHYSLLYYPNSCFTNIDSNHNENNIFLLEKGRKIEDIAYSIYYLKYYKFISLGMEKKIALYDLLFNFQMSSNSLDDKVSYIYGLNDGKILLTDLNQEIKILKIKKNEIIIDTIFEIKDDRKFFGIELINKKLIVGGNNYLSIIEKSFLFGYKLSNSLNLNGFISNIVELNRKLFLVGQSKISKIIVFSNESFKEIKTFSNIHLCSNNYSISKISDDYIAMAGKEKQIISGCIYIFLIKDLP